MESFPQSASIYDRCDGKRVIVECVIQNQHTTSGREIDRQLYHARNDADNKEFIVYHFVRDGKNKLGVYGGSDRGKLVVYTDVKTEDHWFCPLEDWGTQVDGKPRFTIVSSM